MSPSHDGNRRVPGISFWDPECLMCIRAATVRRQETQNRMATQVIMLPRAPCIPRLSAEHSISPGQFDPEPVSKFAHPMWCIKQWINQERLQCLEVFLAAFFENNRRDKHMQASFKTTETYEPLTESIAVVLESCRAIGATDASKHVQHLHLLS